MRDRDTVPFMQSAYGWVFMGMQRMTEEDVDLLRAAGYQGDIDGLSDCGRLDRDWTYEAYVRGETSGPKLGGEGSHTYETQKVIGTGREGTGDVEFKEDGQRDIWHVDPEGNRVYGPVDYPNTGRSFHRDDWGQTVAGPKPGTRAWAKLHKAEGRRYAWQDKNAWWVIRD